MRIDDGLHLVLSGALGFDLSDAYDCNVFMLAAGDEWLVFDAGAGRFPDATYGAFAREGVPLERIGHLFLTHGHADHSGGAAALAARLPLKIYAGAATAALVTAGDEAGIGLARAREAGVYPADYAYRAAAIDRILADDEVIGIGDARIRMIATPGHSADHVCYLVTTPARTILVAGDALFCGGKVAIQDIADCNIGAVCASVRKLAAMPHDVLLPGHLNFSLADAGRHAAAAMRYVEGFHCPPSII